MKMRVSLVLVGLLAFTFLLVYGQTVEKPLEFDAASIKPYSNPGGGGRGVPEGAPPPAMPSGGGLRFFPGRVVSAPIGVSARKIILEAYQLTQHQLSGGPGWLDSEKFSLEAKAEGANESQLRQMLQTLLAERFRLVTHHETRDMPVYALTVGKNGSKLHEWKDGDSMPEFGGANNFRDRGTMQHFVDFLSNNPGVGRPVLDRTGLKGVYVFYVEWGADEDFVPSMQEQLGLKLESQKGPVDVLTIDGIEKPTLN
jgi:uncharacterized protein (TIGR03435 family)